MKKLVLFLLIGSLLLLPLSGCFADNKQNEGTTPNNTTENTTPEVTTPEATTPPENDLVPPEPSYAMSAQAPTEWEIANGDIPILLSFGLKEGCSSNSELFLNIIFEFWNSEKQTYVFKKIDIAEIEKPEYVVEYVYDEERQVVGFNYAHTEEVELPLSMFSADAGYITIAMIEWEDDGTDEGQYGAGGGTILYYKRNGETTLIISDKPIQESTTPDNPPEVTTPDNSQGNNNVPNNDDTSYVIVGTNAADEPMSQYALSAKIPAEWRIANGDIPISLSFGLIKDCEVTDSTYSHILFWFENSAEHFFTFKKISIEEIDKAEYIVEPIWDENREWTIGYTYTHIEDVILPLSIFSENSGIVWICMSELADGDISFESLGSGAYVALHYKKDGEKIIISAIASSN